MHLLFPVVKLLRKNYLFFSLRMMVWGVMHVFLQSLANLKTQKSLLDI